MSFDPLLAEKPIVIFHALAALTAILLGLFQLAGPKGTPVHRVVGWGWVLLLMAVAASSFWIQIFRQFGPFSWIHGLSVFTLIIVPVGVILARRHNVEGHKRTMIGIFLGALVVAGLFTLLPGRVMHAVVFGGG